MQFAPLRQGTRFVAEIGRMLWSGTGAIRGGDAVLVSSHSLGAIVFPGQVDQLAADLQRRQGKKLPWRLRLYLPQSVQQAKESVLQYVRSFRPAAHTAEIAQHPTREVCQPVTVVPQERIDGRFVPCCCLPQEL